MKTEESNQKLEEAMETSKETLNWLQNSSKVKIGKSIIKLEKRCLGRFKVERVKCKMGREAPR